MRANLHSPSLCQRRVRPAADRIERVSDGGNVAGQRQLVGKKKAGAWKPEEVGLRLTILLNNIVKSYYCVLEEINKKWGQTLTFWWKLDEDRLRQSAYWTNIVGILKYWQVLSNLVSGITRNYSNFRKYAHPPDMEFVKKITHPDFQAKSFTPQKCVICDSFFGN